jgi:hypothetical protein
MSTGFPALAAAGRKLLRFARVFSESAARESPRDSHASEARIPGPPALLRIATRGPAGSGW